MAMIRLVTASGTYVDEVPGPAPKEPPLDGSPPDFVIYPKPNQDQFGTAPMRLFIRPSVAAFGNVYKEVDGVFVATPSTPGVAAPS